MDFEEYAVKVGFKIDKYAYGEYQFHKTQVAYDAFKAGQKSKQEEVNKRQAQLDKLQWQIDALKVKVNDALEAFNDGYFNCCQNQLEEILK